LSHSEEEINDAIKSQRLVCKKLLDIMDLQGDIDTLLRDTRRSPFGSEKFKNARPEELQRLVMMTALQFVLFEPHDWVKGNDEFKLAAEKLLDLTSSQLHWLKEKYHKNRSSNE
jgi:predicted RNA-binding protein with RPS1 domain